MRAVVTGGAGFIGSHIVRALAARGDQVSVLDNLDPRVHAEETYDDSTNVTFIHEDVLSSPSLRRVLQEGIDVIFHEAAMVGLGRGGLDSEGYINTNVVGTIRLMNTIAEQPREARPRLVLASSMAIYGEGAYFCKNCDTERVGSRNRRDLAGHCWDPECYECGEPLEPRPVTENHPTRPDTIYAISKLSQELTCLNLGREFQIPIVALRYHNVYGPRMPRNTPYAGVASIFKSKLLAEQSPILYEDGKQLRDFVHVDDIAQANLLVADAEEDKVAFQTFNVGTGRPHSIAEFAAELTKSLAPGIIPEFPGLYRPGDIRHIFADISKIRRLGFKSKVPFETGVSEFAHEPIRDPPKVMPA